MNFLPFNLNKKNDIWRMYLNNFIGNIDAKWLRACCKYWYVFGRLDQFVTVSRLVWNIAKHDENNENNDDDEKTSRSKRSWHVTAKKLDDNGTK